MMLIDTHVHIYSVFDRGRFFAAAARNFAEAARRAGAEDATGCLILTETVRDEAFAELHAGQGVPAGWRVETLPKDSHGLWVHGPDDQRILLVAGRQLVSAERLEVLSIGRNSSDLDGRPAKDIVAGLLAEDTPAILPWGAGKWFGARGRELQRLLGENQAPGVLLGDNAGRPKGWPTPSVFALGRPVLPGSDPLPVKAAETEAGRFGFIASEALDAETPSDDLRDRLLRLKDQPMIYGSRVGPLTFALRQTQLRVAKLK